MELTFSVAPPQSPCVAGLRGQRSGVEAGAKWWGLQGGSLPAEFRPTLLTLTLPKISIVRPGV
jgi:hypothetical protein